MSATDALTDAGRLTARYLSALWVRGLLKLGVVVLFLGGGLSILQLVSAPFNPETIDEPDALWMAAGVAAAGLGVYAAFRYLAAVLEFVFVTSLRTEQVALRRYLRDHLGVGLWLLVFRAVVGVGALAVVAAAAALIVGTNFAAFETATTQQGVAVAVVAAAALFGWFTVDTLTTGFVVPIMQHTRCGPLAGWGRLLDVVRANWTGVLAFLAVAWIVGFALWIVLFGVSFAVGFTGVLLLVLIASALTELHSAFEPVSIVLIVAAILGYYYVIALVEAPVRSYVRYYALVILGETDSELDLIADQRAAIAGTASTDSKSGETADEPAEPAATDSESDTQPIDATDEPTEPERDTDDESTER